MSPTRFHYVINYFNIFMIKIKKKKIWTEFFVEELGKYFVTKVYLSLIINCKVQINEHCYAII